uniref:Uncharacterized protein n=1 Tax=Salix viminalis TaxID=40686 RepID=A0A6N2LLE2_SALVM
MKMEVTRVALTPLEIKRLENCIMGFIWPWPGLFIKIIFSFWRKNPTAPHKNNISLLAIIFNYELIRFLVVVVKMQKGRSEGFLSSLYNSSIQKHILALKIPQISSDHATHNFENHNNPQDSSHPEDYNIFYNVYHEVLKLPVSSTPVLIEGLPFLLELQDLPSFVAVPDSYPANVKMTMSQLANLDKADRVLINTFYKLENEVRSQIAIISRN